MYDWICDNNGIPHISINTAYSPLSVPARAVDDNGFITLNVSENACGTLDLTRNDYIILETRFSGECTTLEIFYDAIELIYDSISGQGLPFPKVKPKNEEGESDKSAKKSIPSYLKVAK